MLNRTKINLFLFLCIAFLLPLISVFLQRSTPSLVIQFILYGIEAAAPSVAALLVAVKERNLRTFFRGNFSEKKIAPALILPVTIAFSTMILTKILSCILLKEQFAFGSISAKQAVIIGWALIAEELGWRGYLQPLLSKHIKRSYLAPFIVGIIWGLWHYHYFLSGGMQVPLMWFFIGCIAESYIYGYLLVWSDYNLLSAMMYHFAWNLFIHVFALNPVDNMGNPLPYIVLTILEILICILLFGGRKTKWQRPTLKT